jgi:HEAT repeat protein
VTRRLIRVAILAVSFSGLAVAATGCGSKPTYTSGSRTASDWAEQLKQPDVEIRRKAALKIGPLMETDAAAFPATLVALKDEDAKVRLIAIRSLLLYAVKKKAQAIPALREMQSDRDLQVREAAAKAADALAS